MKRLSTADTETLSVELKPIFLRHAALPPQPITAELTDYFEFMPTDGVRTVKQDVALYMMESKTEWVSPKELFEEGIGSNSSVYKALDELEQEGKVAKLGRGKYEWIGEDDG